MNNFYNSTRDDNSTMASTQVTRSVGGSNSSNNNNMVEYDNVESIPVFKTPNAVRSNKDALRQFNLSQLAKSIPLPTTDSDIKMKLRELGEPIILFGEKNYERAERLQELIRSIIEQHNGIPSYIKQIFNNKNTSNTSLTDNNSINNIEMNNSNVGLTGGLSNNITNTKMKEQRISEEEFYTEGSNELVNVRKQILMYSLPRSTHRICLEKQRYNYVNSVTYNKEYNKYLSQLNTFEYTSSQIVDERGCSRGVISPCDTYYACTGWSGVSTIYATSTLSPLYKLIGHVDRVNAINYNNSGNHIITASNDCTIMLWQCHSYTSNNNYNNDITPLHVFKGHDDKVNHVEYHPIQSVFGSCSDDKTFRLWDVTTQKEIMFQEGHNYALSSFSFQQNGALLSTCDIGGIGLIWDLRVGKCLRSLLGHGKKITKVKFDNNCYQLITCSEDNSIRVWDLRHEKLPLFIPAHQNAVCDVVYDKGSGEYESRFVLTAGLDGCIKFWDKRTWSVVKVLTANEGDKFISVDITKDAKRVIASTLNKTVKMWEINE